MVVNMAMNFFVHYKVGNYLICWEEGLAPWHWRKRSENRRTRKGQHNRHQQFSLVGCWSL